jgi:hypothetical protein
LVLVTEVHRQLKLMDGVMLPQQQHHLGQLQVPAKVL